MNEGMKKQVNLKEGLWKLNPDGKPCLVGSKCEKCGEVYFPKKESNWCIHCQSEALVETDLSQIGKIVSFSVVMQQPGGGFYFGEVPYAYGQIDLPEKVRVITRFTTNDFGKLKVGGSAELEIEKLHEDNSGNEVLTFVFRPNS